MLNATPLWLGVRAGLVFAVVGLSGVRAGQAQTISDDDYLSALGVMAPSMDLDGLAGQTFDANTVAAPQLSTMVAAKNLVSCDKLQKQVEDAGRKIEIFGADTTLSDTEVATLSKCKMPDTGFEASYLISAP